MHKKSRKSLHGWFWFRVSPKVTVKKLARAAVIWRLHGAWGYPFPKRPTRNADDRKSQSLTSCCQKALVHCHVNLSIGLCDELRKWQLTSPRVGDPTKQGRSCNIFHYLALEVISTICYWLQRSALFNMEGDCIIVELLGFILEPGYYTHLSFKVYLFNSVFYSSKLLNYLNEQSLLAITILSLFAVTQCW